MIINVICKIIKIPTSANRKINITLWKFLPTSTRAKQENAFNLIFLPQLPQFFQNNFWYMKFFASLMHQSI